MKLVALVPKDLGIGYRLAGVTVISPAEDKLQQAITQLNSDDSVDLVLISKSYEQARSQIKKPTYMVEDLNASKA